MTEREHNSEELSAKVNDRRKFNPDGSLREGFEISAAKPKTETPAEEVPDAETSTQSTPSTPAPDSAKESVDENKSASEFDAAISENELSEDDEENYPGADDPASFVNFLSTLATNAAAALGAMPHPATGQRTLDLDTGKYWLDVLAMLKEKTAGNLHPQEAKLLDGILGDLRMQYVQIVRATEERLKQQAAQKFSGNDILGKK